MGEKQATIPAQYEPGWIEKLDGRTRVAQLVTERLHALMADLGGIQNLSYQQQSLCKRAIWMEALIEQQELALARGEDVDQGRLTQAINTLIGLWRTLGLKRQAREVSLTDFLRKAG